MGKTIKYPLVNLCQNIYRNLDLHTPKARSITTLVLACAILYFSSACVDGFNFGVIRYCLSPYPESPGSHPLALLVSSIWNIAELQNMKESCTDPGHLQTTFVNVKKRRFVSTNIYLGYVLPFSCTQLYIINKLISPFHRYLTTLIFIKFIVVFHLQFWVSIPIMLGPKHSNQKEM